MNTITYKGKEYQEVPEEEYSSCKGCALWNITGCPPRGDFPCDIIYKEVSCSDKKEAHQDFTLTKPELNVLINYHKDQIDAEYLWEAQEKIDKTMQYHEDRANYLIKMKGER